MGNEPLLSGGAADRPRVFCIGLNKTGTSSFHEAMTLLGYKSLHWGGPDIRAEVEASKKQGEPLVSRLDPSYDAFSDIEILAKAFERLDREYPGSRFVLTVRPVDDWIDSRVRHVEKNQRRAEAGEYTGNFVTVEERKWRRKWKRHLRRVHGYFGDRPDFVEVDITTGVGWEPFCDLLGVPIPDVDFPWENRYKSFPGSIDGDTDTTP